MRVITDFDRKLFQTSADYASRAMTTGTRQKSSRHFADFHTQLELWQVGNFIGNLFQEVSD
jgi:hypothetical protein